ncbi:MAG TPA: PAS domain-containing protein, partial [Lacipirellulaceae bacterium]|nr:PAS domain-containing protein [Lacipirellulaceae bacterium]
LPRVVAFRDGDSLTAAADELRQSKGRFDRALGGAACGLWEWNIADGEAWFAPRFRELLGYRTESEFPSKFESWEQALHPDDRHHVLDALNEHLQQNGIYDVEYRLRTKDGEYRWFSARGVAIRRAEGQPYLMSGSIQDVHDRKLAEQTLRQMEEYSYQKHKMESLGELAGGIAHEFNNMLQAIGGQVQLAESILPKESEARTELATASKLVDQASQITQRLLAFSHHGGSEPQPLSPNDVLEQLKTILHPMLNRQITLNVLCEKGLGLIVVDPVSLQQALLNLCINARDAMPDGGTLTVATAHAKLDSVTAARLPGATRGKYVSFSVSDTGPGIPNDLRARIFEPFFTTKGPGKGTGLGLAIASGIAQDHHGFIDVESQTGKGSTFRVWIPVAKTRKARRRKIRPSESHSQRNSHATILYAEDDKYVRRYVVRLLRTRGFRVIVAGDGARAVRRFERHSDEVDLALLDISMPELDGTQLFRRLRHIKRKIPVLFCTGHSAPLNVEKLLSQPNTYLINKPFQPISLWQALDKALSPAITPTHTHA